MDIIWNMGAPKWMKYIWYKMKIWWKNMHHLAFRWFFFCVKMDNCCANILANVAEKSINYWKLHIYTPIFFLLFHIVVYVYMKSRLHIFYIWSRAKNTDVNLSDKRSLDFHCMFVSARQLLFSKYSLTNAYKGLSFSVFVRQLK